MSNKIRSQISKYLNKCEYCEIENSKDLSDSDTIFVWVDNDILTVEYDGKKDLQFIGDGVNIDINYCPICGKWLK